MTTDRLYGRPGAEYLYDDLATVYEEADWGERPDRVEIEEWTVTEPIEHLPNATTALEYLAECACDELVEHVWCTWETAATDPDVVAAMQATLELLASKVTGRMASKHVATHTITFDDEGEPILNGERLYRPAASS